MLSSPKQGIIYRQCRGRFHTGQGAGNYAGIVAALDLESCFLHCFEVNTLLFLRDRGSRSESSPEYKRHSIGYASQYPTAVVCSGYDFPVYYTECIIVFASGHF